MNDFVQTLSDEQRAALLKALTGDDFKPEVESRWQHEEPISEAVDGDFTMHKDNQPRLGTDKRRLPVKARENKFVDDTSEHSDVTTPNVKVTPRNRKPPVMKQVVCHVCGKKKKVNAELLYGEYYRCDRCIG
jgi:hypothetical protein